jgi:hypothetical protein
MPPTHQDHLKMARAEGKTTTEMCGSPGQGGLGELGGGLVPVQKPPGTAEE